MTVAVGMVAIFGKSRSFPLITVYSSRVSEWDVRVDGGGLGGFEGDIGGFGRLASGFGEAAPGVGYCMGKWFDSLPPEADVPHNEWELGVR